MEALITKIPEKEFNTWMRGVYPISCGDNIIKLFVDNGMNKYILENEYEPIILGAIKEITGKVYSIELLLPTLSAKGLLKLHDRLQIC